MNYDFSSFFIKTQWQFDIEQLNRELDPFLWVFKKFPSTTGNQLINLNCLQTATTDIDQLTDNKFFVERASTDNQIQNWNKNRSVCNSKREIWSKIPDVWCGSFWPTMIKALPIDEIGRVRFFYKPRGVAGLIHIDDSIRYHLVLTTNTECHIIMKDYDSSDGKLYHLPADGYVYKFRANLMPHYAVNAGNTDRIHLVWNSDEQT